MDAPQAAAAMSLGQAITVLWPYLTAAGAVVAALIGWIRSLAVRLAAFDGALALNRGRIEHLEQSDVEQDALAKEQKARFHDRLDEMATRLAEHAELEEHPIGKVRREQIEKQLAEMSADVRSIKASVELVVRKVGA